MAYDIIIAGGTVIDGSGDPGFAADVAIAGDRIVAIGDLSRVEADRRIDATGRVVAPGFIDNHTHDDGVLLTHPDMTPKLSQGVTSVVIGNCGISLAPLAGRPIQPPLNLLGRQEIFTYGSFAAYFEALERNGTAVNAIPLVGHTTLRVATMERLDRAATPDEAAAMRKMLEEGLEAGAVGFSTGVFYPNAHAATAQEVVSVGKPLKGLDAVYCAHIRNEADWILAALEEAFEIGRQLDAHTVISHHKLIGIANHGRARETLGVIHARRMRQSVGLDAYPYPAGSSMLNRKTFSGDAGEKVMIAWSDPHPEHAGRDFFEVQQELGLDVDAAIDYLSPAGGIYFQMAEADVRTILAYPETMIGSDGLPNDRHPHPRLWGTFPRVIGHYGRDLGLFPIETAVYKMTGLTARQFRLKDRGFIRVGCKADVTIFDPETIRDLADWANPHEMSVGIERVLVNGTEVWRDGRHTNATPGEVIRRHGRTLPPA
ncbi:N-acyl-D-amino-acid deacylase family protein [Ensifer soli]|uniref:N-acyl-D-amino-acid deacylase family protein n=1 Tax=Ciceribacter sp. sgz301302 TaxID=3342379 RepID=UPI0035B8C9C6